MKKKRAFQSVNKSQKLCDLKNERMNIWETKDANTFTYTFLLTVLFTVSWGETKHDLNEKKWWNRPKQKISDVFFLLSFSDHVIYVFISFDICN